MSWPTTFYHPEHGIKNVEFKDKQDWLQALPEWKAKGWSDTPATFGMKVKAEDGRENAVVRLVPIPGWVNPEGVKTMDDVHSFIDSADKDELEAFALKLDPPVDLDKRKKIEDLRELVRAAV